VIHLNSHTTSAPGSVTRRIASSASRVPCTFPQADEIVTGRRAPSLKGAAARRPRRRRPRPLVLAWKGSFLTCLACPACSIPSDKSHPRRRHRFSDVNGGSGAGGQVEHPVAGACLEDPLTRARTGDLALDKTSFIRSGVGPPGRRTWRPPRPSACQRSARVMLVQPRPPPSRPSRPSPIASRPARRHRTRPARNPWKRTRSGGAVRARRRWGYGEGLPMRGGSPGGSSPG